MIFGKPLRSVFVSDLHLGYKGADIGALNAFLRAHHFHQIYLIGDILDGWKLEKRWYWNQEYSDFLDILIGLVKRDVSVVLLPGNHDEKLRRPLAQKLRPLLKAKFGLQLEEQAMHQAADGRKLLVIHGDQFDGALLRGLSRHADGVWSRMDDGASWSDQEQFKQKHGDRRMRWSLGKAIATQAKALIGSYADAALKRAAQSGADGIICGHSHVPSLTTRRDLLFGNCGSWTGARNTGGFHTEIAEGIDGSLELVRWPSMRGPVQDQRYWNLGPDCLKTNTKEAAQLARLAHRFWAPGRLDGTAPAPAIWHRWSGSTEANR